jgi:hypothetical protein
MQSEAALRCKASGYGDGYSRRLANDLGPFTEPFGRTCIQHAWRNPERVQVHQRYVDVVAMVEVFVRAVSSRILFFLEWAESSINLQGPCVILQLVHDAESIHETFATEAPTLADF